MRKVKDNRGNKEQKIKGSHENQNPDEIIKKYLYLEGEKKFGDIFYHVKNSGLNYSKQGLIKKLNSMDEKGDIRKNKIKGKHPIYSTSDKEEFIMQCDGYSLKDYLGFNMSEHDPYMIKDMKNMKVYQNDNRGLITQFIFLYGIQTLFLILASYRRIKAQKRDEEENRKLQEIWLRNALSYEHNLKSARPSIKFIVNYINHNFSKKQDPKLNDFEKEIKFSKEIEEELKILFPETYEIMKDEENMIDTDDNKFMRDVQFKNPYWILK